MTTAQKPVTKQHPFQQGNSFVRPTIPMATPATTMTTEMASKPAAMTTIVLLPITVKAVAPIKPVEPTMHDGVPSHFHTRFFATWPLTFGVQFAS